MINENAKDHPVAEQDQPHEEHQTDNLGALQKYVLVYTGNSDLEYFKDQNLYLSCAIMTKNIEEAKLMSLDEAEKKLNCMHIKDFWEIWSIKPGIVLDEKSNRHTIRNRRAELEKELAALPNI